MTTLVIFGATGDLTARKLVPSLYRLDCKGRLPDGVRIVGVARTRLTDDAFRERLGPRVKEFVPADWEEQAWKRFAGRLFYAPGDAGAPGGLDNLRSWLEKAEGGGPAKRLYYLAVSPELYGPIAARL